MTSPDRQYLQQRKDPVHYSPQGKPVPRPGFGRNRPPLGREPTWGDVARHILPAVFLGLLMVPVAIVILILLSRIFAG